MINAIVSPSHATSSVDDNFIDWPTTVVFHLLSSVHLIVPHSIPAECAVIGRSHGEVGRFRAHDLATDHSAFSSDKKRSDEMG